MSSDDVVGFVAGEVGAENSSVPMRVAVENAKNNPGNNRRNNRNMKLARQTILQESLRKHTKEGEALSEDQAKQRARKIMPKLLEKLPQPDEIDGVVIGVCNASRGDQRTREHYPFHQGWHATGAKSDDYDPITVDLLPNRLSIKLLEDAMITEMKAHHTVLQKNGGGGGTLGIKSNDRGADGAPIYMSDPQGYRMYAVFRITK